MPASGSPTCTPADKEAQQALAERPATPKTPLQRKKMAPGIGFALAAMVCFGLSDLIYKRGAAAGFTAGEFLMAQAWIFCPTVTLYAWLTGTLYVQFSAIWGGLAGFFLFIALFNFTRSLQDGAVSTNAPIFRLNFTITAALAILLLGETLTVTKALALVCALLAVWLLLAEAGEQGGKPSLRSLTRVLIATAAMALTNLFYKVGLQNGAIPETMVAAQAWVFCTFATGFTLMREGALRTPRGIWPYAACAALALFVAFVALLHGLALGPASVLVPVGQMSFVFTALIGAVMFHEKLDAKKYAGLAVAVAALALFAVS
jgi:drug/metabolite transporter (DMT)-like permease